MSDEMTLHKVYDWAECRNTDDEAWIHAEDVDWMKELAQNIRNCGSSAQIRLAERQFHQDIKERYNGKVAGALLLKVWQMTKGENNDQEMR